MSDHGGSHPVGGKSETYFISNMDCVNEEKLIRDHLGKVAGIANLAFDLKQQRLQVSHALESDESIVASLKAIGMRPVRVKSPAS